MKKITFALLLMEIIVGWSLSALGLSGKSIAVVLALCNFGFLILVINFLRSQQTRKFQLEVRAEREAIDRCLPKDLRKTAALD
jgi:hypothetical protein